MQINERASNLGYGNASVAQEFSNRKKKTRKEKKRKKSIEC